MKRFIYKYNLEMLSVFLLAEFILTMVFRAALSPGRIITGENIHIDGGQTRLMIYHGDHG